MNAPVDVGAAGHGGLAIVVEIADDRVCSVRVVSTRPTNLARLFVDRPAEEAPLLAERIFSLCGASHRVVAARAVASARNGTICVRRSQAQTVTLIADRLGGTLRSNMILALHGGDAMTDIALIRPLGEILSLARELGVEAFSSSFASASDRKTMRSLIRQICALGRDHALCPQREGAPLAPSGDSAFEPLARALEAGSPLPFSVPDALGDTDDSAILERVRAGGDAFAAAPSLPGRAPETGAFARCWRETDFSKGALAARFEARMIDLAECFRLLERADKDEPEAGCAVSPSPREGFAVAETSRGRLYHWVRLSADDRIADYQIVAPTEWNFHPAGPFVAALLGAAVPREAAERRIVQLAGLIDPCVPFRVEVKEHVRA
ncbi:MAG TPA: nickel-dependent hydrogenase large subunit [Methylocystis sp.]|nr:nickel-dependent hydrogenase large subunit [Methylocystis sp.]